MNWEQKIENLAARAQAEPTPRVDVTHRVLDSLLARQTPVGMVPERLWMWLAAASTAVAVPVGMITWLLYAKADPLREIAEAIAWAIQ